MKSNENQKMIPFKIFSKHFQHKSLILDAYAHTRHENVIMLNLRTCQDLALKLSILSFRLKSIPIKYAKLPTVHNSAMIVW